MNFLSSKLCFIFLILFLQSGITGATIAGFCDGTACDNSNCQATNINCNLCNAANCLLSNNCFCPSKDIPHGISLTETPQFVFFTVDDAVFENSNYSSFWFIDSLRSNTMIRDAVGCPIRPTLYVMQLDSDFSLIAYYEKIGTVAVHSTTHTTDLKSTQKTWENELLTDWADIKELAHVSNIWGSRCPYLECNDGYYQTLKNLGILFDSSSSYYPINNNPGASPSVQRNWWPFTLDFGYPNEIGFAWSIGNPVTQPFPGVWEVPMTGYQHLTSTGVFSNTSTSKVFDIMDYDVTTNPTQAMTEIKKNFDYNYKANRAPLGFYFHSSAFLDGNGNRLPAYLSFWNTFFQWVVATYPNVLFATEDRAINWIKNSSSTTTFQQTKSMSMFACPDPTYTEFNGCSNNLPRSLCYKDDGTTYSVCGTKCPNAQTKPNINLIWQYTDGSARTYVNDASYFDSPYGGVVSNTNYPRIPLTDIQINYWLLSGTSSNGVSGFATNSIACFEIDLSNNSNNYGVNGFVLSINWIAQNAALSSWNFHWYNSNLWFYTNQAGLSGFRLTGNQQTGYMRAQPYKLGSFCLNVNTNSNSACNAFSINDIRFGLDSYSETLWCSTNPGAQNPCTLFCGNGICDTGESSTTCPIDCLKQTIPTTSGCTVYCGNGICDSGETITGCPVDCNPNFNNNNGTTNGTTNGTNGTNSTNSTNNTWTGTYSLVQTSKSKTGICLSVNLKNPKTTVAVSFILTIKVCNLRAQITSLWGFPSTQITSTQTNTYEYRIVGNGISYTQNVAVTAVGLCLAIKSGFSLSNDVKMGVDLKSVPADSTITNNIVYCGNNACGAGETATICPIDCAVMKC